MPKTPIGIYFNWLQCLLVQLLLFFFPKSVFCPWFKLFFLLLQFVFHEYPYPMVLQWKKVIASNLRLYKKNHVYLTDFFCVLTCMVDNFINFPRVTIFPNSNYSYAIYCTTVHVGTVYHTECSQILRQAKNFSIQHAWALICKIYFQHELDVFPYSRNYFKFIVL